jgi:hypothetical protein
MQTCRSAGIEERTTVGKSFNAAQVLEIGNPVRSRLSRHSPQHARFRLGLLMLNGARIATWHRSCEARSRESDSILLYDEHHI